MTGRAFECCVLLGMCFFQAEDGIRYLVRSRGLGDVYKRQRHALRSAARVAGGMVLAVAVAVAIAFAAPAPELTLSLIHI